MALQELRIAGYRSLRNVRLPLQSLNVITGPNGSGKSNLYRALWLMARVSEGDFASSISREGGLPSALWAGPRTDKKSVRMSLGFQTNDLSFEMSCGYPQPGSSMFAWDARIKEEMLWIGRTRKPTTTLLERRGGHTLARDADGNLAEFALSLSDNESVLSQLRDPVRFPVLYSMRDEIRGWRFYHGFRTDDHAPMRLPRISALTPVLAHDGGDMAAALQTIREIGDSDRLSQLIDLAFPGRELEILISGQPDQRPPPHAPELCVGLRASDLRRVLHARELSDGTLKFLCLLAALMSPRPPAMLALNEPEASLHPDLLEPLAQLIVAASEHSQIVVCTHSETLVLSIEEHAEIAPIRLELQDGETVIQGKM